MPHKSYWETKQTPTNQWWYFPLTTKKLFGDPQWQIAGVNIYKVHPDSLLLSSSSLVSWLEAIPMLACCADLQEGVQNRIVGPHVYTVHILHTVFYYGLTLVQSHGLNEWPLVDIVHKGEHTFQLRVTWKSPGCTLQNLSAIWNNVYRGGNNTEVFCGNALLIWIETLVWTCSGSKLYSSNHGISICKKQAQVQPHFRCGPCPDMRITK